jgi:uncharacterized protein YndB with AHSA1/START domain
MNEAAATRSVIIEREFAHAPEKVWRALTQGALIEEWLMKNDFEPRVGHQFKFRSTPYGNWDGIIDAEVLAVEPPSRLSYTWTSMGLKTVVEWTLTPTKGGTHLLLEQSGFPAAGGEGFYKGATAGWTNFIGKLESILGGLQ